MKANGFSIQALDDLNTELACAVDLLDVIHDGVARGECGVRQQTDALFALKQYLWRLSGDLEDLVCMGRAVMA